MTVLDESGEQVGTVSAVKMGDPEAATTRGNEPPATGTAVVGPAAGLSDLGGAWPTGQTEPDVPEPRRSHLLRLGYMKVGGHGPLAEDRYIAGDEIVEVVGDAVHTAPAPAKVPPSAYTERAEPVRRPSPISGHVQEWDSTSSPWRRVAFMVPANLALAGVGVWAFRRWQRERNRPINRLRRQARQLAQWLPDADAMQAAMPGMDDRRRGLGAAALVGLAAGWLLRERTRPSSAEEQSNQLMDTASATTSTINDQLLQMAATGRDRGADLVAERRPFFVGGALAGVGLFLLARRLMSPPERPMYIGTPGVESALGRDRTRTGELDPYLGREQPRTP